MLGERWWIYGSKCWRWKSLQVVHMVSAAKGAVEFYQTAHVVRHENIELARQLDDLAAQVESGDTST